MNCEFQLIWKETAVVSFEILSRNFTGWIEEYHENHQSIARPIMKLFTIHLFMIYLICYVYIFIQQNLQLILTDTVLLFLTAQTILVTLTF
jgi:hypothetical protein